MPIYEYECHEHGRFEELIPMLDCGLPAKCKFCAMPSPRVMSAWGRVIFAAFDTVVNPDGVAISRKQTTEQTPMLPEKVHGGRF